MNADGSGDDIITLGNGAGYEATADAFGVNHTIILGNGAGDMVSAVGLHNTITLGNGNNDTVHAGKSSNFDTITLGNGAGDVVNAYFSNTSTITLGIGAGDMQRRRQHEHNHPRDGAGDMVSAVGQPPTQSPSARAPVTL